MLPPSTVPGDRFRVEHCCLTAYGEAARVAVEGGDVYDREFYWPGGVRRRIGPLTVDPYHYPPPFLLVHGDADQRVEALDSKLLADRLRAADGNATLLMLEGAGHTAPLIALYDPARDPRVLVIKLADRLHNMRTLRWLKPEKQERIAKQTLEIFAPLAHRLGMNTLKWELEDRSFEILHPRKYAEIKAMVAERRADREAAVGKAGEILGAELAKVDIPAEISGRAKHFYSIYDKMAKKGREFNESTVVDSL